MKRKQSYICLIKTIYRAKLLQLEISQIELLDVSMITEEIQRDEQVIQITKEIQRRF